MRCQIDLERSELPPCPHGAHGCTCLLSSGIWSHVWSQIADTSPQFRFQNRIRYPITKITSSSRTKMKHHHTSSSSVIITSTTSTGQLQPHLNATKQEQNMTKHNPGRLHQSHQYPSRDHLVSLRCWWNWGSRPYPSGCCILATAPKFHYWFFVIFY